MTISMYCMQSTHCYKVGCLGFWAYANLTYCVCRLHISNTFLSLWAYHEHGYR